MRHVLVGAAEGEAVEVEAEKALKGNRLAILATETEEVFVRQVRGP